MKHLLLLLFCVLIFGCSQETANKNSTEKPPQIDVSKAATYRVLKTDTKFYGDKKLITVFIDSPNAKGLDERAQTIIKAALEASGSNKAGDTEVLLMPDEKVVTKSYQYARARYLTESAKVSPEQDTWTVDSSDDVFSAKDIETILLYEKNADRFTMKDGTTDNNSLNRFVAKQMHIKTEDFDLPAAITYSYEPKFKSR